ncbi:uncharacterized protein Ecym_1013 [Eremothecium cymbalariae DBVPG|uniref:Fe2OG dioxygenase domain-containing protein n=1 Tax=Eremothecium cymbalariae (strain CBS 270.75 / DBVPG 7215 / KCTC 17166 / NRRL Y-17582) TaxID=931890 RepID=G8JM12_ERECY|nr:hypothetical protein Ecym_1013 [Eremothecium cymbalariae DBVPG\
MNVDDTTDEKLAYLQNLFPSANAEVLLDLLVSCNGSVRDATLLLDLSEEGTQLEEQRSPPRKVAKVKGQQSLSSFLPLQSLYNRQSRPSGKPIILYGKKDIELELKYCTYHTDVLPEELANRLLKFTMNEQNSKPNEFYLFGNKCVSNCRSAIYSNLSAEEDDYYYNGMRVQTVNRFNDDMVITRSIIEKLVNEQLQKRLTLPFQTKPGDWKSPVVISNIYAKDSDLQWHSDRMTYIGPHSVIATLSLGFSRGVRFRRVYPSNSQIYTVMPEHNSVLIMHAGCQEEFKHCVPPLPKNHQISKSAINPISQTTRVSLTFRDYKVNTYEPVHCDKCGYPMDLRRIYKTPEKRGHYIWLCTKSYTAGNGLNNKQECGGLKFARFNHPLPTTTTESEGSFWVADDDFEALKFCTK